MSQRDPKSTGGDRSTDRVPPWLADRVGGRDGHAGDRGGRPRRHPRRPRPGRGRRRRHGGPGPHLGDTLDVDLDDRRAASSRRPRGLPDRRGRRHGRRGRRRPDRGGPRRCAGRVRPGCRGARPDGRPGRLRTHRRCTGHGARGRWRPHCARDRRGTGRGRHRPQPGLGRPPAPPSRTSPWVHGDGPPRPEEPPPLSDPDQVFRVPLPEGVLGNVVRVVERTGEQIATIGDPSTRSMVGIAASITDDLLILESVAPDTLEPYTLMLATFGTPRGITDRALSGRPFGLARRRVRRRGRTPTRPARR